jgi:hypothetical protein
MLRGGSFWIEDLASPNGTYVNNRLAEGATRLPPGAVVEVGSTLLRLIHGAALASVAGVVPVDEGLSSTLTEAAPGFNRLELPLVGLAGVAMLFALALTYGFVFAHG